LILIYFLIYNHKSILILALSFSFNHYTVNFSVYFANWLEFRFVYLRLKHFKTFNIDIADICIFIFILLFICLSNLKQLYDILNNLWSSYINFASWWLDREKANMNDVVQDSVIEAALLSVNNLISTQQKSQHQTLFSSSQRVSINSE